MLDCPGLAFWCFSEKKFQELSCKDFTRFSRLPCRDGCIDGGITRYGGSFAFNLTNGLHRNRERRKDRTMEWRPSPKFGNNVGGTDRPDRGREFL